MGVFVAEGEGVAVSVAEDWRVAVGAVGVTVAEGMGVLLGFGLGVGDWRGRASRVALVGGGEARDTPPCAALTPPTASPWQPFRSMASNRSRENCLALGSRRKNGFIPYDYTLFRCVSLL